MTEQESESWYEYGLSGLFYDTANFITGEALEYLPAIWTYEESVEEFIEMIETHKLPSDGAPTIFHSEVITQTILDMLNPNTDVVSLGMAYKTWSSHFFRMCKIKEVLIFSKGLNEGPSYLVFMKDSSKNSELTIPERQLCQKAAQNLLECIPTDHFFNPVDIFENRWRLPNAFVAVRKDKSGFAFGDPETGGDAKRMSKKLTNIDKVYSTISAFLVVKSDKSIICWGNPDEGGEAPERTTGVAQIIANQRAFCILYDDGSVDAIGDMQYGGVLPNGVLDDIVNIDGNERAFWATKEDGTFETWGDPEYQNRDNKPIFDMSAFLTRKIS